MGQQSIHNMEPIQVCSYPTCPILPAPILFYLILPAILPALSFQALKAAEETLQLLCSWLPRHYPDRFAYESRIISNHTTGESFDTSDPAINPLYVASLLVQVSAYQILQLSLCMWPAFSCKWVHISQGSYVRFFPVLRRTESGCTLTLPCLSAVVRLCVPTSALQQNPFKPGEGPVFARVF